MFEYLVMHVKQAEINNDPYSSLTAPPLRMQLLLYKQNKYTALGTYVRISETTKVTA